MEVEDFQRYLEKVHTSLYECPIESSPLFLLYKKGKNSSKPKTSQNKKVKDNAVPDSQLPSHSMHTILDADALQNSLQFATVCAYQEGDSSGIRHCVHRLWCINVCSQRNSLNRLLFHTAHRFHSHG